MGGYGLWVQNGKGEKQWGGGSANILVLIKISTMSKYNLRGCIPPRHLNMPKQT
jgi:hypothetical protein